MKEIQTKKRILALGLAAALAATMFVGCKRDEGEQIEEGKTQLYVATYYAGLGDQWLRDYKTAFEEFYAETSFEEGKTGVQVIIDYVYAGGYEQAASLCDTRTEVIWMEDVPHNRLATSNLALDITDLIEEPLTEFGEEGNIASKMDPSLLAYYKSANNGKVFGLPHYDYLKGVVYDVDVFEGKQSAGNGFYLAANGGFTTGLAGAPTKANGPDGIPNTYDDGLPATHDEFFLMMDEMVRNGVVPFTFPGMYAYADTIFRTLWANAEGEEQMMLNFDFSGTAKNLIEVADDGTVTELPDTPISNETGDKVFYQEGRYRAYQFLEKFVRDSSYYSSKAFGATQSHTQAEEDFLYNIVDGQEKIAMTVNGIWWEEEAVSIFTAMEDIDEAYSRENRRLAWMPMPFYDGTETEKTQILVPEMETTVFIKKNIDPAKVEVAEKFLQFTSTDKMLVSHVESISVPRSLKLSDESLLENNNNLTHYGKSVLEMRNNSIILSPFSTNRFQWHTGLTFRLMFDNATINGATYIHPLFSFYDEASLTAEDYFNGVIDYHETRWENFVNTYDGD